MSEVFFVCNSGLQLAFAKRLASALHGLNLQSRFYTSKVSVLISKEAKEVGCKFLWEKDYAEQGNVEFDGILNDVYSDSIEGKLKTYSGRSSKLAIYSIFAAANREAKKYKPKYCFLWMPWSCMTRAAALAISSNNVEVAYVEISNFPERTVVDTHGVNASSLLSLKPDLINELSVDSVMAERWLRKVEELKSSGNWPPQSLSAKNIDFAPGVDMIAGFFGMGPMFNLKGFFGRVFNKFFIRFFGMSYKESDLGDRSFIFYPMQVSSDSQLLLNSDYDNWQAIDFALSYAKSKGLGLVVKPHPAEIKADVVRRLNDICAENSELIISSAGTEFLISRCEEVVTINSTVGQEAIIQNKKVQVLGRAFFKSMSRSDLVKYLYAWLMPIDVFSDGDISSEAAREILERLAARRRMGVREDPAMYN